MKRLLRSKSDYAKSILRNQLTSLILFESVTTTTAKAKKLAQFANHFFHKIRKGGLNEIKFAHQTLYDQNAVKKSFEEILRRYSEKDTNFVKVIKIQPRSGDNASQSIVVWLKSLDVQLPKNPDKVSDKKERVNSK